MSPDQAWLTTAAFLRATAVGMIGVLLGGYLAQLGVSVTELSWIVGAGLAGATLAIVFAPAAAARMGRRRYLTLLTLLSAAGAIGLALSHSPRALAMAAFIGMVNGMGRDRGAGLVLEQALLPDTTDHRGRTAAFARYNVVQDVGHALGGLLAALPRHVRVDVAHLDPKLPFERVAPELSVGDELSHRDGVRAHEPGRFLDRDVDGGTRVAGAGRLLDGLGDRRPHLFHSRFHGVLDGTADQLVDRFPHRLCGGGAR